MLVMARVRHSVDRLAFCVAVLVVFASDLNAQLRVYQPPPDCNLAAKQWDSPFSQSGGLKLRRYEWHAIKATSGVLLGEGIHRTTDLPRWASALSAATVLTILPHTWGGFIKQHYPIAPLDWAFDAFVTSAPLILWATAKDAGTSTKALAATTFVAGYFATACFGSP